MNRSALSISVLLVALVMADACFAPPFTMTQLRIEKIAEGAGGTLFDFEGDFGLFSLGHGDLYGGLFFELAGDYDITERPTPGWLLSDIYVSGVPYDLITDGVRLHIPPEDNYPDVTFVNEPVPLPGAALLGAIGLSFAGWRLRRRTC